MDTNEIINQLREENQLLKTINKGLAAGRDKFVEASKELGYQFSTEVSPLDYLIETARSSVMVNQKSVELTAQLVAVQDSVVHGKCANSEPCANFCEAIATRKMFKQLQDDRNAYQKLADSMAALMVKHKRVFTSKELKGAENHLAAHDAEVAAKAVENCLDVKRFRWLCENVTDEVCQSGELVALKTKYKLPLMIAYADFCGPIRFADAVDLKMQEQAAQLRAKAGA